MSRLAPRPRSKVREMISRHYKNGDARFERFDQLPIEIRLKIWGEAMIRPDNRRRIIKVITKVCRYHEKTGATFEFELNKTAENTGELCDIIQGDIGLLSACHESRREYNHLRKYALPGSGTQLIRFGDNDIIHLGNPWKLIPAATIPVLHVKNTLPDWFAQVKYLAVDKDSLDGWQPSASQQCSQRIFSNCLAIFPNAKMLVAFEYHALFDICSKADPDIELRRKIEITLVYMHSQYQNLLRRGRELLLSRHDEFFTESTLKVKQLVELIFEHEQHARLPSKNFLGPAPIRPNRKGLIVHGWGVNFVGHRELPTQACKRSPKQEQKFQSLLLHLATIYKQDPGVL